MWNWSKFTGKALINIGVLVLGICAAKELFDAGCVAAAAMRDETPLPDTDGIPHI